MILSAGLDPAELDAIGFAATPHEPGGSLPDDGGWILVGGALPDGELGALLRQVAAHPGDWSLFLVVEGGLVPLPVGPALSAAFVSERRQTTPEVFSVAATALALARIRHDLNNPLTAALAETQLLRLDSDEEGLAVIEEQLRRLRDLILELGAWRLPR
jgi:signal transduction histidine kinase